MEKSWDCSFDGLVTIPTKAKTDHEELEIIIMVPIQIQ